MNYNLPNFYGTSDAAPERGGGRRPDEAAPPARPARPLRAALIQSAIPLNGTPKGTWDAQGGFGLVQAPAALHAVDNLRVISTDPGHGESLTVTAESLSQVQSQDDRPDHAERLGPASSSPTRSGVTITPASRVLDPTNLSRSCLPAHLQLAAGDEGQRRLHLSAQGRLDHSTDGKPLVVYSGSFGVVRHDRRRGVTDTNVIGRYVTVTFNEHDQPGHDHQEHASTCSAPAGPEHRSASLDTT